MKLWTALVKTESCDTYVWVFDYCPTERDVIIKLWEQEQAEDLEWYLDTTSVTISEKVLNDTSL